MSSKPNQKVLVICGPTATGKTALGVKLAKTFNGEIISADSRQVYKGMDALTGKGDVDVNVKVWLQDVVDPEEDFNVAKWRKMFWDAANKTWNGNKLPIVVGLTGFYLSALTSEIKTIDIPPNKSLRKNLEGKCADELAKILKEKDPERFNSINNSDKQNPRRLIRAIEVAKYNISHISVYVKNKPYTDFLFIGLNAPTETLDERINKNIEERVEDAIEETRELLLKNISLSKSALQTHGFKSLTPYIRDEITLEDALQRWKTGEHQDARKQYTRLKKEKRINWFDITKEDFEKNVEDLVANWYTSVLSEQSESKG